MCSFTVEAIVRGYHIHRDIWRAVVGEEFSCKREINSTFDPFAEAVMRSYSIIGHVPRKISSICFLFLHQEGLITCQVFGATRYSGDLVKGGLEIQCILSFEGGSKIMEKARKLLEYVL